MWRIAAGLLLAAAIPVAAAEPFSGTVTRVRDGDTIEVDGRPVRLKGIAAPERRQPLGEVASRAMRALALGQRVVCAPDGSRSYERIVAICELSGVDLAAFLVARGLARDCPRFSGGRYAALEAALGTDARIRKEYPLPAYCRPKSR
ncbi:hypothetical protein HRbin40_00391 [bacterium HR40]|nr:hypothetical protein HRbin40_00391 [bacterium HR40]